MAMDAQKKAVWPGALKGAMKDMGKETGTGNCQSYGDMHGMERHQHEAEPSPAKIVKYDD